MMKQRTEDRTKTILSRSGLSSMITIAALGLLSVTLSSSSLARAFTPKIRVLWTKVKTVHRDADRIPGRLLGTELNGLDEDDTCLHAGKYWNRRKWLQTMAAGALISITPPAWAAAPSDDEFSAIAARASAISKELGSDSAPPPSQRTSDKTCYDFVVPVQGKEVPFADAIQQQMLNNDGSDTSNSRKIRAILITNIKQDDPIARKDIPELISLAAKYGGRPGGALSVVVTPTDQGYFEPDTSALIRLKLASEYGYGINPATVLTDKMNLLGTGT
jgi:hypothetical protein